MDYGACCGGKVDCPNNVADILDSYVRYFVDIGGYRGVAKTAENELY